MMTKDSSSLSMFFNELLKNKDVESNDVEIVNDGFLMTPKKRSRYPLGRSCSFSSCSTCSTQSSSGYLEPGLATIAECIDEDCSYGEEFTSSQRWNNPAPPNPSVLRIPQRPSSDRSINSFNSSLGSLNSSCASLDNDPLGIASEKVSMPPIPPQRRISFEAERENPFRVVRPARRRSFDDRSKQAIRGAFPPPSRGRSFDEKTTKLHSKTIFDVDGLTKSPLRKVSRVVSFDENRGRVRKPMIASPSRSASFDERDTMMRRADGLAPPFLSRCRVLEGSSNIRMPFSKIKSCVDKTQRWMDEVCSQRSSNLMTLIVEFSYFVRKELGIPLDRFCYGAVICNLAAYTWQWENRSSNPSSPTSSTTSYKLPQHVFEKRRETFGRNEPFLLLEDGEVNEVRIRDTDESIPELTSKWFCVDHYKDYFALPNDIVDGDGGLAKGGLSWATKSERGFSSEEIVFFRSIHPLLMSLIHFQTKDLVIQTLTEQLKKTTTSEKPSDKLESPKGSKSPIPRNLVLNGTSKTEQTNRFGSKATDTQLSRPARRASLY